MLWKYKIPLGNLEFLAKVSHFIEEICTEIYSVHCNLCKNLGGMYAIAYFRHRKSKTLGWAKSFITNSDDF